MEDYKAGSEDQRGKKVFTLTVKNSNPNRKIRFSPNPAVGLTWNWRSGTRRRNWKWVYKGFEIGWEIGEKKKILEKEGVGFVGWVREREKKMKRNNRYRAEFDDRSTGVDFRSTEDDPRVLNFQNGRPARSTELSRELCRLDRSTGTYSRSTDNRKEIKISSQAESVDRGFRGRSTGFAWTLLTASCPKKILNNFVVKIGMTY